jgi:hypothetical protein
MMGPFDNQPHCGRDLEICLGRAIPSGIITDLDCLMPRPTLTQLVFNRAWRTNATMPTHWRQSERLALHKRWLD